jgi:NAD(P)-dependent dehydrogenase (short-subunit alcohol dehydrogenase family)
VIVTGAAGGIGRAVVQMLSQAGCSVGACDLHEPPAEAPDGHARAAFDVRDRAAVDRGVTQLVEALGGCDALVANAGVVDTIHRAERFPEEAWERDLDSNLTGQFNVARASFEALAGSGDGRVVFVSSASAETGLPGQVAYTAAKAGIVGMARTLAAEWAPHGIRVNVIMPGLIATPKTLALPEPVREQLTGAVPLGRLGEPDELAGAIAFLLSDAAAYMTGSVLRVDGGLGLNQLGLHRR